MDDLIDISELCDNLGITSRTLRFYEQKRLITCTLIDGSNRRKYSKLQVEHIKYILILRTLGFQISTIKELIDKKTDLLSAVKDKKAIIYAQLNSKRQELKLLEEAALLLDNHQDISDIVIKPPFDNPSGKINMIADLCTDFILSGSIKDCYPYFTDKLLQYLPESILISVWKDTCEPLGRFIRIFEKRIAENVVTHILEFEKLNLQIRYVFHIGLISGLWFDYVDKEK